MLVEATAEFVAGGWPGGRYAGTVTVAANMREEDDEAEVRETLERRAKQKVAEAYCMTPGQVTITELRVGE